MTKPKPKPEKKSSAKAGLDPKSARSSAKLAQLLGANAGPSTLSVAELRHNSAEVISRVALGGERIVITRNRKPVAALIPVSDYQTLGKVKTR